MTFISYTTGNDFFMNFDFRIFGKFVEWLKNIYVKKYIYVKCSYSEFYDSEE